MKPSLSQQRMKRGFCNAFQALFDSHQAKTKTEENSVCTKTHLLPDKYHKGRNSKHEQSIMNLLVY